MYCILQIDLTWHSHLIFLILFYFLLLVNLGTIGYAISVGWMGIQFMKYDSDASPLPSGKFSKSELGWTASILGIGGLAGTIASGWMADFFGRKNSLLAMALPEIVSYIFILQNSKDKKIRLKYEND